MQLAWHITILSGGQPIGQGCMKLHKAKLHFYMNVVFRHITPWTFVIIVASNELAMNFERWMTSYLHNYDWLWLLQVFLCDHSRCYELHSLSCESKKKCGLKRMSCKTNSSNILITKGSLHVVKTIMPNLLLQVIAKPRWLHIVMHVWPTQVNTMSITR